MLYLKLSVLLLFAALNAGAQSLVFSGGGAASLIEHDVRVPKRGLNGLQFSLSYEMPVKGKFSASAGVGFSARGYLASMEVKDQNNVFIGDADIITKTNYLSFPLLGHFTFGKKTALRLSGGLVASVLVSAQRTTPFYNYGFASIAYQTTDVRAAFRSAELAALFQVGVYRKLGETWGAQFNFGYQQAFTKALKNAGNARALYALPSLQLSVVKEI